MRAGSHQLLVTVPGLPAYRVTVTMPDSRSLRLPVIRLSAGVYFRVRLVSPTGEPIIAPQLRRRLFDVSGKPIVDRLGDRISDPADNDGAITIGPLPRGIMSVAVDTPLFAQTRLPDVNVGDATNNVDGRTIAIQQPGAVLHVDVLDETGAPVPDHDVFLDDARPRSPLVLAPVRTNQQGRATFDRLAMGRYRAWRERTSSSCTARADAGRNASASSTATDTRRSDEIQRERLRGAAGLHRDDGNRRGDERNQHAHPCCGRTTRHTCASISAPISVQFVYPHGPDVDSPRRTARTRSDHVRSRPF